MLGSKRLHCLVFEPEDGAQQEAVRGWLPCGAQSLWDPKLPNVDGDGHRIGSEPGHGWKCTLVPVTAAGVFRRCSVCFKRFWSRVLLSRGSSTAHTARSNWTSGVRESEGMAFVRRGHKKNRTAKTLHGLLSGVAEGAQRESFHAGFLCSLRVPLRAAILGIV